MIRVSLPSRPIVLAGGFYCDPRPVPLDTWQAHLVKHPLGVNALRSRRPWHDEGWSSLEPPVITAEQRALVVDRIVALGDRKVRCGVRELRGGNTPVAPNEPCYDCPSPLMPTCAKVLDEAGLGQSYAAVIESLLLEVAEDRAVEVPCAEVAGRLVGAVLDRPAWIARATLMAVGYGGRKQKATVRIARADGTRSDYYLAGNGLTWRTTYRVPVQSARARVSHLMDLPRRADDLPLSDRYVVARGWWEDPDA